MTATHLLVITALINEYVILKWLCGFQAVSGTALSLSLYVIVISRNYYFSHHNLVSSSLGREEKAAYKFPYKCSRKQINQSFLNNWISGHMWNFNIFRE